MVLLLHLDVSLLLLAHHLPVSSRDAEVGCLLTGHQSNSFESIVLGDQFSVLIKRLFQPTVYHIEHLLNAVYLGFMLYLPFFELLVLCA